MTIKVLKAAIAQVGLAGKEEMDFELLSGGEKQRVMIARAIVQTATTVTDHG